MHAVFWTMQTANKNDVSKFANWTPNFRNIGQFTSSSAKPQLIGQGRK